MRARNLRVASYYILTRPLSNSATASKSGEYERIVDAYSGKSVLVTGGTGFVGKILIERLLYNCVDIKNIYVLMRQKKDVPLHTRLEGMFSLPIFTKLKETRPEDFNKLIPVYGDLLEDRLGIKATDQKLLEENVSMVFHTAASVSFKAQLKQAMDTNYSGTQKVIDLTKRIKNLESFVYFSTAFVKATSPELEEEPVPPIVSQEQLEKSMRTGNTSELLSVLDAPMYIFSKSVAENLVVQESKELPTTIIRPSAVTACLRDPLPGWMDTWIAHPSFFVEHSRGLVSAAVGHRDVVADIIPADYVANLAIVAAARGRRSRTLQVYNCCSGDVNPMTWQQGADLFRQRAEVDGRWDLPPKRLMLMSSPLLVAVLTLVRDTLPALLRDLALVIRGKTPKYTKMHLRARFIRHSCIPVMRHSVIFRSSRTLRLAQSLDDADRAQLPFDPTTITWPRYLATVYDGIYKYMHKKYAFYVLNDIDQSLNIECRVIPLLEDCKKNIDDTAITFYDATWEQVRKRAEDGMATLSNWLNSEKCCLRPFLA
ncbi:putative fatty acyl-CoA reductase CG5065 [Aricia agestis]|uniref:putative fatty acyl-CoA reductase CG5065 n=1 Tax=Aricia agestis TaxID=91739 RepID=UPI001C20B7BB|nr:putative fatty acyl-CoA reductase CG5065 [Aricia agestis]